MLKSMTAFARQSCNTSAGTLTWEVRSVNHRYLEPHFRLPEPFREIEPALRELLRKHLGRGKVECSLKWQHNPSSTEGLSLNAELIQQLKTATSSLQQAFEHTAPLNMLELLSWPGVMNAESGNHKQRLHDAIASFEDALTTLNANRQREGTQLAPLFEQRLQSISSIVSEVRQRLPNILEQQNQIIRRRFDDACLELDPNRLEQEMVLLAQKSDVAEELERLDAHVTEVNAVLARNEPVGRRLDFLMQELNREANTLSSKSIVTDTTQAAVELKVLIEQMREQVQNIE